MWQDMKLMLLAIYFGFSSAAAWKIIKGWMMPEAAARVKMVGKEEIKEYIDPKEMPVHMGGTDTYEYSYVPGKPLGERVSC